ncbi:MAG: hypothetical protein WAU88_15265 [Candidatus Zixiibacteriota bacterium]
MFIGHFGVGLGAKRVAPAVSLGTLFIAAQFLDLLWPTLLLIGTEHVALSPTPTRTMPLDFVDYPISHSLLVVGLWSLLLGTGYWFIKRRKVAAITVGLLVLSHWLLDLIVHIPDLPLYPGNSPMVGLGLWRSPIATTIAEGGFFVVGMALYLKSTKARDKIGSIGIWILIGLLVAAHLGNLFSPPPTDVNVVAWGAQLMWLIVLFAYWVDRHRRAIAA